MKLSFATTLLAFGGGVLGNFWMEDIGHHGRSPFNPDPNYQVFRNVRDFGAKGDGGMTCFRLEAVRHNH